MSTDKTKVEVAQDILDVLNIAQVRATYGAVAGVLGIHPRSVSKVLGRRRPEASWVVSAKTGRPSGYAKGDIHPSLGHNTKIISTAEELSNLVLATSGQRLSGVDANQIRLVGVDLAWHCEKNFSGLAIGCFSNGLLFVESALSEILRSDHIANIIEDLDGVRGVAIDAPLIVRNKHGSRPCEKELNSCYASRWAGAHPTNLTMPWKCGIELSRKLELRAFRHLGRDSGCWQIECYPHPAIVELFGLDRRLKYKNKPGMTIDDIRRGQIRLANYLGALTSSAILRLDFAETISARLQPIFISRLKRTQLKQNEDFLDSILCLYIAGLYQSGVGSYVFGDLDSGYIYVPRPEGC